MPLQKRPYRPKVKGCYECSQRRISCDRVAPQCGKCCSRGLKCSGFNVRYRFTEGVNTRGKWAGEPIDRLCEKRQIAKQTSHRKTPPSADIYSAGIYSADVYSADVYSAGLKTRPQYDLEAYHFQSSSATSYSNNFDFDGMSFEDDPGNSPGLSDPTDNFLGFLPETIQWPMPSPPGKSHDMGENDNDDTPSPLPIAYSPTAEIPHLPVEPVIDDIPSWKRGLLLHFSEHIAGEMLAIDGTHNGWRYIVLPMAHADELVMNAVLAVSAFHRDSNRSKYSSNDSLISSTDPGQPRLPYMGNRIPCSQALYDTAIEGLQGRSNLTSSSYGSKQATLVAVLVLLVAAMVTGGDEYPTILGMLCSATKIVGGEHHLGSSELGGFLVRQVRKMRVYAAPYISEIAGTEALSSQFQWDQYFDCVRHCGQSRSENAAAVAVITNVMQQAHDIYLQGVVDKKDCPLNINEQVSSEVESNDRIERFKETLEQLPADGPGMHVLVWATFLAAAASSLECHRNFFEGVLLRHYSRSKFANLLKGIKHLPYIWAKRDQGARWTQLLSEAGLFLM